MVRSMIPRGGVVALLLLVAVGWMHLEAQPKPPAPPATPVNDEGVRAILNKPAPKLPKQSTFREFLELLNDHAGLAARIDMASYKRFGMPGGAAAVAADAENLTDDVMQLYDQPVRFPIGHGYTVGEALREAISQLPGRSTYRIRGSQVLIVPAFTPPNVPGNRFNQSGDFGPIFISQNQLMEWLSGEAVSFRVKDAPLSEALKELQAQTGANIVLDPRCKDAAKGLVSGSFDDVRLLTVLETLADMVELKPVAKGNVFYITSADNAMTLIQEFQLDLYGQPPLGQFKGPGGLGCGGFGGLGGLGGQGQGIPPADSK